MLRKLPEEQTTQWLFWSGSFEFREDQIYGEDEQLGEMERFVQRHRPYSKLLLKADTGLIRAAGLFRRAVDKGRRLVRAAW